MPDIVPVGDAEAAGVGVAPTTAALLFLFVSVVVLHAAPDRAASDRTTKRVK